MKEYIDMFLSSAQSMLPQLKVLAIVIGCAAGYFLIGKLNNEVREIVLYNENADSPWLMFFFEALLTAELLRKGIIDSFLAKRIEVVDRVTGMFFYPWIIIFLMAGTFVIYALKRRNRQTKTFPLYLKELGLSLSRLILDPIALVTFFIKPRYDDVPKTFGYKGPAIQEYTQSGIGDVAVTVRVPAGTVPPGSVPSSSAGTAFRVPSGSSQSSGRSHGRTAFTPEAVTEASYPDSGSSYEAPAEFSKDHMRREGGDFAVAQVNGKDHFFNPDDGAPMGASDISGLYDSDESPFK